MCIKVGTNEFYASVFVLFVIVSTGLLILIGGAGNKRERETVERVPVAGDIAVLQSKTGVGVVLGATEEDYNRVRKLARAKDSVGLFQMELTGRVYTVEDGTQCLVIDRGFLTSEVRIQSGRYSGRSGFVSSDFLKAGLSGEK